MKSDTAKLIDIIRAKDDEIKNLRVIIRNYKEQIQSLQMQLLGIQVLEVKLRNLTHKHEKETEEMKRYYETESANLTKEVMQIHKTLSTNLSHDEKFKLMQKELQHYKEFNIRKMQVMENKIKELQDLAERASNSPMSVGKGKSRMEGLRESGLSGVFSFSPVKADKEGNVLRDSTKFESVVLETFDNEANDAEVTQNEGKDEFALPSPDK